MDDILVIGKNRIAYKLFGKGSPIVFLHGFLESKEIWSDIAKMLSNQHRILLIDLPGHGKSELQSDQITMIEMAESVKAVLHYLNFENSVIFGHSMGGYVGLELTKLMKINLALIHSNFWNDDIEKRNDRDRVVKVVKQNSSLFIQTAIPNLFYHVNKDNQKENIAKLIAGASKMDNNIISSMTIGMRDRKNNEIVLENQKIAIVQGEFDPIIPENKMKLYLKKIKNRPYYISIANCGHMGFLEQPETFFKAIQSVIDKFCRIKVNN